MNTPSQQITLRPGGKESQRSTPKIALLSCGILSSLLYVFAVILGQTRWPGYDPSSQAISELIAINAPSAGLVIPLFIVYSLLIFAFGCGVWIEAGPRRNLRIAAVLLISKEVLGLAGTLFAPMHMRGATGTLTDTMHIIITAVGTLLCIFPAMALGAASFGKEFRLYTIATMIAFIFFGILASLQAPQVAANLPTPWLGVWERINVYGYMLWIMVLSFILLGPQSSDQPKATWAAQIN